MPAWLGTSLPYPREGLCQGPSSGAITPPPPVWTSHITYRHLSSNPHPAGKGTESKPCNKGVIYCSWITWQVICFKPSTVKFWYLERRYLVFSLNIVISLIMVVWYKGKVKKNREVWLIYVKWWLNWLFRNMISAIGGQRNVISQNQTSQSMSKLPNRYAYWCRFHSKIQLKYQ